jgi:NitT/TauT family transport system substrate-binding protein
MTRLVRSVIAALVLWVGAAAGVGAQTRTAIVVAPIPSTDMTPFYWALQQKLFEKAGLDVTVSVATSGAASMQAVIGKAADIGVSNTLALVTARGKNIPIVVVAAGSMYRSDILNDLLLKTPDNPAKTGKDMEGKTVAVTGLHDLLGIAVQSWIAQNGGDPSKVNFVEMPSAMMQPALDAKRVDFVAVYEPFVSTMLRNGAYKQFAAPFNSIAPSFMSTAWFAMGPWASEHKAAVATFNRVMSQAAKYVDAHYEEQLPLIAQFTKLPIETLKGMSRVYDAPSLDPATLQPLINTAFKAKEIPAMFNASDMVFAGAQ